MVTYALASKSSNVAHIVGINGHTLCGRVVVQVLSENEGGRSCQRCARIELRNNPIDFDMQEDNAVNEYGMTDEDMARVIEQEKALAAIEPWDSPVALCGDAEALNDVETSPNFVSIERMFYGADAHAVMVPSFNAPGRMMVYTTVANRAVAEEIARERSAVVAEVIDQLHAEAIAMGNVSAEMDEAYGAHIVLNGLALNAYLSDVASHRDNGHVKIGGFWDCCENNESRVIVFDDGSKYGVCRACANQYPGEVEMLPAGQIIDCEGCAHRYIVPLSEDITEKADDMGFAIRNSGYADMPFSAHRNGYVIARFADIASVRMFLNLPANAEVLTTDEAVGEILTLANNAIKPLQAYAATAERQAWNNDADEAEQWTTVARDLTDALSNIEWMISHRSHI